MKSEIVKYEPIHALLILEKNIETHNMQLSGYPDWEAFADRCGTIGPAYTLLIDGEPAMCAGLALIGWDRGEAWTLLSSLFYAVKYTAFKFMKTFLSKEIAEKKLRRVQALVEPESEAAKRLAKHLGFEPEGTLKMYGPLGEDFIMFGRVC